MDGSFLTDGYGRFNSDTACKKYTEPCGALDQPILLRQAER